MLKQSLSRNLLNVLDIRCTKFLELVHTDLADLKNTTSKGGKILLLKLQWKSIPKNYLVDFSRYTTIFLLKTKDEASNVLFKYEAEVENQLDKRIKRLRFDRRGEHRISFNNMVDFKKMTKIGQ